MDSSYELSDYWMDNLKNMGITMSLKKVKCEDYTGPWMPRLRDMVISYIGKINRDDGWVMEIEGTPICSWNFYDGWMIRIFRKK
uniref:DUF4283 domain-containing protein n=1 Tax=Acrobeloides nanus TaxID=290746 RepID=A0A914CYC0_9BILA